MLLAAGHTQAEVAEHIGASVRAIRRIAKEGAVSHVDDAVERERRKIGRPSLAEAVQPLVCRILADDSELPTREILRRATLAGDAGKKSALYARVARLRPRRRKHEMRFEGLAGAFSPHDFGPLVVTCLDGRKERIHCFGSRRKGSRMVQVTIVADETADTLCRTLLGPFVAFGGVPPSAVFDHPKTVALSWKSDGTVTEWNPTMARAATESGRAPSSRSRSGSRGPSSGCASSRTARTCCAPMGCAAATPSSASTSSRSGRPPSPSSPSWSTATRIDVDRIDVAYVERCLVGAPTPRQPTLFPKAPA